MILINSAAYVGSEFRSEVGAIPPCFLPLGNRKLLQHQVNAIRNIFCRERIVVSLPFNYKLALDELSLLSSLNVEFVKVPEKFSLGESITYVLNVSAEYADTGLRLLHGDTLILDMPESSNSIAVSPPLGDYDWEFEPTVYEQKLDSMVWSGYFSFSSLRGFLRALALSRNDFVTAVREYSNSVTLAVTPCRDWFDLGHVNTYFLSRSKVTTQRSFNQLNISDGVLYKTGTPSKKIEAEYNWFNSVPSILRKYTPHLLGCGKLPNDGFYYELEYLPFLPLNEIFVHGRNSTVFWEKKLNLIRRILITTRQAYQELIDESEVLDVLKRIDLDAKSLFEEKTLNRLIKYASDSGFDLNEAVAVSNGNHFSLKDIASVCIERCLRMPVIPSVLHGDLCFSNILFDSRSDRLKLIDPRGLTAHNVSSIYGDQKYDLAKVAHSVIGLYDFIIADCYVINIDNDGHEFISFELGNRLVSVQERFFEISFIDNIKTKDIMPAVVLLFLSMLPLHSDNPSRQKAMRLNAVRLFKEYVVFS